MKLTSALALCLALAPIGLFGQATPASASKASRRSRLQDAMDCTNQGGLKRLPSARWCATSLKAVSGLFRSGRDACGCIYNADRSAAREGLESMPSEALPDLPPVNKFLLGYEASTWNGVAVPRNTSTEIIDKLNRDINAGLADPNIKTRLTDLGATALVQSSADFGKLIADETEKWAR